MNSLRCALQFVGFGLIAPRLFAQQSWTPADRVAPAVTVQVYHDATRGLWVYNYTISNGASARQPIVEVIFGHGSSGTTARAPKGWTVTVVPDSILVPDELRYWKNRQVILVGVKAPWDETTGALRADQKSVVIQPGRKLGGFVLESTDAPGVLSIYLRGFTPLVSENDLPDPLPDWLADSRKVEARGPVRRP